jgi:hypothetical protein
VSASYCEVFKVKNEKCPSTWFDKKLTNQLRDPK